MQQHPCFCFWLRVKVCTKASQRPEWHSSLDSTLRCSSCNELWYIKITWRLETKHNLNSNVDIWFLLLRSLSQWWNLSTVDFFNLTICLNIRYTFSYLPIFLDSWGTWLTWMIFILCNTRPIFSQYWALNVYNGYSPIGIAQQLFSQYCFSFVFIAFGFSLVERGECECEW